MRGRRLQQQIRNIARAYKNLSYMFSGPALVLVLLSIAGCGGANLRPATGVRTLPGEKRAAVAETTGVQMIVEADSWSGNPSTLERIILPLEVMVENHSEHPLRIRYNEFTLVSPEGFSYAAIPPYQIKGAATVSVNPRFYSDGFYVAPYYHRYYGRLRPWGRPWAYDSFYYDRYYQLWQVPLPTEDMLEEAIPEGVVEPKGRVSGFLYFQKVNENLKQVTFKADLIDAETGYAFGTIQIPFDIK